MAKRSISSSPLVSSLFLFQLTVGLMIFVTACTTVETAALRTPLPENQRRVRLVNSFTGRYLAVSANGTVRANGLASNADSNLILEVVDVAAGEKKIKREDSDTYVAVTSQGRLKAVNGTLTEAEGSTVFTLIQVSSTRFKFQTTVQYSSAGSSTPANRTSSCHPATIAVTCYIAIDTFYGDPPSNVCQVTGNEFSFDDDETLDFDIRIRPS